MLILLLSKQDAENNLKDMNKIYELNRKYKFVAVFNSCAMFKIFRKGLILSMSNLA